MWARVNLLAGCECIIFHNQPAACVRCSRENEAAVALQMERHLRGANVFAGCIFLPPLGGDKERGATEGTSAFY